MFSAREVLVFIAIFTFCGMSITLAYAMSVRGNNPIVFFKDKPTNCPALRTATVWTSVDGESPSTVKPERVWMCVQ